MMQILNITNLSMLIGTLTYATIDALLFFCICVNVFLFRGGMLGKLWSVIGSGLLILVICDLLVTYGIATGWYYEMHPIEFLGITGGSTVALGLARERMPAAAQGTRSPNQTQCPISERALRE